MTVFLNWIERSFSEKYTRYHDSGPLKTISRRIFLRDPRVRWLSAPIRHSSVSPRPTHDEFLTRGNDAFSWSEFDCLFSIQSDNSLTGFCAAQMATQKSPTPESLPFKCRLVKDGKWPHPLVLQNGEWAHVELATTETDGFSSAWLGNCAQRPQPQYSCPENRSDCRTYNQSYPATFTRANNKILPG